MTKPERNGPSVTAEDEIIVGGQAVLEGVMMRSPSAWAVSVRLPNGSIESRSGSVRRLRDYHPILALPVVRGAATLVQSMVLGIKALNFSAAAAMAPEESSEVIKVAGAATPEGPSTAVSVSVPAASESRRTGTAGPLAFALLANVVLFIVLPLVLTNSIFLLADSTRWPAVPAEADWMATTTAWFWTLFHSMRPTIAFNVIEGVFRVGIFIGMVLAMSRARDIHRLFQYHGAEHKVVMAYECGDALTVEAARPQSRRHPRCGTSFLMVVMIVAIVLFSMVRFDTFWANAATRVALLPLIAGLSYEVIRAAARQQSSWLFRLMVKPGLWLQGITTQEPDDDQLEVAIHALQTSLALEPQRGR
jgi:uncharacterized protein YqhQ